jgi:hypothetical protein
MYNTFKMWSSVVLLECDVVGLSLDERNNIALNNVIPIAYSGQISRDNNYWFPARFSVLSPHTIIPPPPNDQRGVKLWIGHHCCLSGNGIHL